MAKDKAASSPGVGAGQVKLSVLMRQQMHAAMAAAHQFEKESPGAMHAVDFQFRGFRATFRFDRNREMGGGRQLDDDDADEAASAQRRPTQPVERKPRANKPKAAKSSDKGKAKAAATDGRAADQPMEDVHDASSKKAAAVMRKHITDVTTEVVRSLGGDPVTGGQYLCPEKTPLRLFGHELRAVRLPKGCPAADMPLEQLVSSVESIHANAKCDADGNLPEAALRILRKSLTPRAEQAPAPAPIFGAAMPTRPSASFMTWSGPQGAAASSSSPPIFGRPQPSHGG